MLVDRTCVLDASIIDFVLFYSFDVRKGIKTWVGTTFCKKNIIGCVSKNRSLFHSSFFYLIIQKHNFSHKAQQEKRERKDSM